jgi:PKHD-type hydroxylase
MKNLWEVWTGALPGTWCDELVERAKNYAAQDSTIGFDAGVRSPDKHRSSTVRWLDANGGARDIADRLMEFVRASNRSNFGFKLDGINELQFTEYQSDHSDHYDWHHDVWFENPAPFDRKLSVVVQMSEPELYDGAEFEFFGMPAPGESFLPKGSVLLFPSFFLHRVKPIRRGTRYSLVSWVDGPKWA